MNTSIEKSESMSKLVSEGEVRNAYGVHTVRISKYGGCSETCLPWQGKIYVDDVWSGGTKEEAEEKKLPLLSEAIEGGLFHPNCKHRSTTYFYDLKKEQGKLQDDGIENPPEEQEHGKNKLHIQQHKRLEEGSLDPQNIKEAKARKEEWIEIDNVLEKGITNKRHTDYSAKVDIEYINSKEFKDKFKKISDNPDLNEEIYKNAKAMLVHRSGTGIEDMYLIDSITGKTIAKQTSCITPYEIQYTEKMNDIIKASKEYSIISIHNHGTNIPPSGSDFISCGYRKYKFGLVVCHDGSLYLYKSGKKLLQEVCLIKELKNTNKKNIIYLKKRHI